MKLQPDVLYNLAGLYPLAGVAGSQKRLLYLCTYYDRLKKKEAADKRFKFSTWLDTKVLLF
jgi:hypothetical protein